MNWPMTDQRQTINVDRISFAAERSRRQDDEIGGGGVVGGGNADDHLLQVGECIMLSLFIQMIIDYQKMC